MIRSVLGSRASIGGVLGSGRGGAAPWYLAGGVSAANCVAAYQPIGAASLAASYTNLANPGVFDAAPGVAPTWAAATGWAWTGTQYLTTGIKPTAFNTWSMIVRFSDATDSNGTVQYLAGVDTSTVSGSKAFALTPRPYTSKAFFINGNVSTGVTQLTTGVMCVAGLLGYVDGAAVDSISTMAGTPETVRDVWIGGRNGNQTTNGLQFPLRAGKIQAVAIYNATLSAAQVAAISSAMAAL